MSVAYLPTDRATGSRASSRHPDAPPPYSTRPSSYQSDTSSHASSRHPTHHSHPLSHHSTNVQSRHSSSHSHISPKRSPSAIEPILEGPQATLCTCSKALDGIMHRTRADALHIAKHIKDCSPLDAEGAQSKLIMINIVRCPGVGCHDIGLSYWEPLKTNPSRDKIPDMSSWTVRAQMNYYLEEFAKLEAGPTPSMSSAIWREALETYSIMARCFETMGCMECTHGLVLRGSLGGFAAKMEIFDGMMICHDRRTGHRYAAGCCGNGAYLVGGELEMIEDAGSVTGAPRGRFVFRERSGVAGSGSKNGSGGGRAIAAEDARTVCFRGSSVPESRHGSYWGGSRRDSHAASCHGSHQRGRSRYVRSEANGWLEPTGRSERGVPASVAGSGGSADDDTSSILPGESSTGYAERNEERWRSAKRLWR